MREIDGLVYTEEEVKLDRLEKHIFVWKVDLEGGVGESNMHLEALLAERLMRESALLMQTLRSYAVPECSESTNGTDLVFRSEMGVAPKAYRPQPLMKEESVPLRKIKEKSHERKNREVVLSTIAQLQNCYIIQLLSTKLLLYIHKISN
jgi:hypothetical protein